MTHALQTGTVQLSLGIVPGTTHIHPTRLARVRGWVKSQILWCNAHNIQVGAQMAKLAALWLVQPVGGKSTMGGPINQEARAPPLLGFPHTMLGVKKVKDNMRLAFIEKLFTNHEIGTNLQTRYFCFKGMSYENENYLCDINYVQLRKALARFWCDNTQLEAVLGAWKGMPYAEKLGQGYDLGKVKDEEHLLLVCPNTHKVRERFCSSLPLTHTSTIVELMQTTNMVALAKFVACCQYKRTICPPWSTFRLMDFLVPNGCKIINSKQTTLFAYTIQQWCHIVTTIA